MRIVHVVEPFSSGVITSIIQLCSGISEFEHVVVHGIRTSQDEVHKVRQRFPKETKFHVWNHAIREINITKDILAMFALFRLLQKIKPDVLHLHSSKAGGLGRIVGKILGLRILYSPHCAPFLRKDISKITYLSYIFIEKALYNFSNEIICCSQSESEEFKKINLKTRTINNGISISSVPNKRNTATKLTIGCAAIATHQKNPFLFNKIAAHYEENKNIDFKWIGDGEESKLLTSKNISLTGWLNKKETENELKNIDIYLSCSLWEGLPYSVIEAMNLHTCLLLNECVGNVDLVKNELNGYLFSNYEEAIVKIDKLIDEPKLIINMGNASKEICKKEFGVDTMCMKYKELYINS